MHELAVTESLLEIAVRHAREAEGMRVTALYLVVGQLSTIVDESVQFYWDIVSRDTMAEGARLHFRRVPAELACEDCGARYGLDGEELSCPACGSAAVRVEAGTEFQLEAIDVDGEEPEPVEASGRDEGGGT